MDHPEILTAMRTGYPSWNQETEVVGVDSLGNDIYEGDELLIADDQKFVYAELTQDAIEILELFGAYRDIAK